MSNGIQVLDLDVVETADHVVAIGGGKTGRFPTRNLMTTNKTIGEVLAERGGYDGLTVGEKVSAGDFVYRVAAPDEPDFDRVESGVRLRIERGASDWVPEAFGAVGDGVADDTAAIVAWLKAIARATAQGPVYARAQGNYLVDELPVLSQKEANADIPLQQDSVYLDLRGACFTHSGVGNGILTAEGHDVDRYLTELVGGQFVSHANSKWLLRARDLRGSLWAPEMLGTSGAATNTIGIFATIQATWSENMAYGGNGAPLEFRNLAHGMAFAKRAFAWCIEAYWAHPEYFATGTNNLGAFADDAAAEATKGSAASEGDYYYQTHADGYKGFRVHNGASWVHAMNVRGEVWAWTDGGYGESDPTGVEKGHQYLNTATSQVRVYDGSAFHTVHTISGVNTILEATGVESFARNKIKGALYAACFDPSYDGIGILCLGAALYDSEISGGRGNVRNGGGALYYLNGNYFLNTVIENIGLEKANRPGDPRSSLIRVGPEIRVAPVPPIIDNVSWTGGYAYQCDPDAGFVFTGEMSEFVEVTAETPAKVLSAGLLKPNTTVTVTVRNNANTIVAKADVFRKNGSDALRILGHNRDRHFETFYISGLVGTAAAAKMDATKRFVAPRGGSIVGITAKTDAAVTAGSVEVSLRHNVGDLNTNGGNKGVAATVDAGYFAWFRQDPGADEFGPGDDFYAVFETTDLVGPTAVQATIELLIDGPVRWFEQDGDLMITTHIDETALRVFLDVSKT